MQHGNREVANHAFFYRPLTGYVCTNKVCIFWGFILKFTNEVFFNCHINSHWWWCYKL